jgi:hypothetical protein
MVSPAREYSLEQHLLDHLKYSGIRKENLADLVDIAASLKNKNSIVPFTVAVQGEPVPNAPTARYLMDTMLLNKLMNLLSGHATPGRRFARPAWLFQSHEIRSQRHTWRMKANFWQTRTMDAASSANVVSKTPRWRRTESPD